MVFCSGCLFQKPKQRVAFVPPPPKPPVKLGPRPDLPSPPLLAIDIGALFPPVIADTVPDLPPPRVTVRPRPPLVAGPKPPATLPDQPAPPKLGPLFTPEQIREYTRDLEDRLERVRRQLAVLGGKRLNAEQFVILERIRTFQKQAEEARQGDLFTAVNLAKRADELAQDLLARTQ